MMMESPADGADLTINLNGNKIRVHKSILIEKCEYFSAMLTSDFIEAHSNEVKINYDIDVDIFKSILNYIYTDEIEISTGNMKSIYNAATYFLLETLKKLCLIDRIDCKTVEEIHNFAVENHLNDVSKVAFDFKVKHFERILKTRSFLNWKLESVAEILQSDKVVVSGENKMLKFVTSWVTHDYKERRKSADSVLLQNIRFQDLKELESINVGKTSQNFVFTFQGELSSKITTPRQYQKGLYIRGQAGKYDCKRMFQRYCPIDGSVTDWNPGEHYDNFSKPVVIDEKLHYFNATGILSVYDAWTNQCKCKAPINYPFGTVLRCNFDTIPVCCAFRDRIYAFKGCGHSNNWRNATCRVKSNSWKELSDLPFDIAQSGVRSVASCGDSIYLIPHGSSNLIRYTPSTASCIEIACPYNLEKYKVVAHKTKLLLFETDSNGHIIIYDTTTRQFKHSFCYPEKMTYSDIVMYNDYICLLSRTPMPTGRKGKTNHTKETGEFIECTYPVKLLNADFMDKPMYQIEPQAAYLETRMAHILDIISIQ